LAERRRELLCETHQKASPACVSKTKTALIESWIEAFGMVLNEDGKHSYVPFVDD
jgi:hypothetical protein